MIFTGQLKGVSWVVWRERVDLGYTFVEWDGSIWDILGLLYFAKRNGKRNETRNETKRETKRNGKRNETKRETKRNGIF